MTQLYSLSISARATLDMHSLNNEGGEGNQIQTRMVNIVDQHGQLQNVNAISGDMFKHIQAEHLFRILREDPNIPLCTGCKEFNANRINADREFIADHPKDVSDAQTLTDMIQRCAMDDIEGILITEGGRSTPRKSVIEFGWVVGVPDTVETDSYFHVKYARAERTKGEAERESEKQGANLGQAIFHRPASSGIYAAVCHIDLTRIGFNDISQEYVIDDEQRLRRARALLQSVLYAFMQPNGAMRTTQAPHMVGFEGVVSLSAASTPAPTVSPLKDGYKDQIQAIAAALNGITNNAVEVRPFAALDEFTAIIGDVMQNGSPYKLRYE